MMQVEYILSAHGIGGGTKETPLPNVEEFTGVSNDEGTNISLSWKNPEVVEFDKVQVFMSENDISNLSYEYLIKNMTPIVDGKTSKHTVGGLNHNDIRYFKIFGLFTRLGELDINSGVSISTKVIDIVPPGNITDMDIIEEDAELQLSWKNPSDSDFDKVKILYSERAINNISDGIVAYEGSGTNTVIKGLKNEVQYNIRAFTIDKAGNINDDSVMKWVGTPADKDDLTGSPGNDKLLKGTLEEGYFGSVSGNELITGESLTSRLGVTQGTSQHSNTPWHKFAYKNKILFVAQKTIRNSISWDHLNSKDLVYGNKTIEINGIKYKIRLLRGALTDPSDYSASDRGAKGSEWNRLIAPLSIQRKDNSWDYPAYMESDLQDWETYLNDDELTVRDVDGRYSWCQEVGGDGSSSRVNRGFYGVSYSLTLSSSYSISYYGWRPVLEVI